jgi:hypothetical protein
MDNTNPTPGPDPLDDQEAGRLAGLTGYTADAARTFLTFHTGRRWLHPLEDSDA